MAIGRLADSIAEGFFDQLAALTWYGAVFYTSPFTTDPLVAEVVGGYQRAAMTVDRVSFNLIRNANDLVWRNLAAGTQIAFVGAFDSPTNGRFIAAAQLVDPVSLNPAPVTLQNGGTWDLSAGDFAVGLDAALGP